MKIIKRLWNKFKYRRFLKSRKWKKRREKFIRWHTKKYGTRCDKCKTRVGVLIHHEWYGVWGKESNRQLSWLCKKCHKKEHR